YLLNAHALAPGYTRFYVPGLTGINAPPERGYTVSPNEGYLIPVGSEASEHKFPVYLLAE
ncbi:MAG: hypothetical protein IT337_17230, partial [Thermomicrobiales bacterium]|nr:hypothetical protein [Thermomicrobiales bacterium]